jgi:hypothetical protein
MALNMTQRGFLEQTLDHAIANIPTYVNQCRTDEAKKAFQYRNPEDFALGLTIGNITTGFDTVFRFAKGRGVNANEMAEIIEVIRGRMPQIRSALFEAG